jgi:hypothetical protein
MPSLERSVPVRASERVRYLVRVLALYGATRQHAHDVTLEQNEDDYDQHYSSERSRSSPWKVYNAPSWPSMLSWTTLVSETFASSGRGLTSSARQREGFWVDRAANSNYPVPFQRSSLPL